MAKKTIWYLRRSGKIKGPFPAGQISQYVLLGRISTEVEASQDKEVWVPIKRLPELIPEVMVAALDDEDREAQRRLQAARRWADERRGLDEEWEQADRRNPIASEHSRMAHAFPIRQVSLYRWMIGVSVFVMLVVFGVMQYTSDFELQGEQAVVNCKEKPAPGVNWSNCRMSGLQLLKSDLKGANLYSAVLYGSNLYGSNLSSANLSYADLSMTNLSYVEFLHAILKGASLHNADLTNTDLSEADLSYADLTGAKLQGAILTGSRLGNTIWIDGRTCLPDSVGICNFGPLQ